MEELYLITAIVNKGQADMVVRKAEEAGAQGATWFTGKGSGVRRSLGMTIIPEKEVIFIVTREDETKTVYDAIIEAGRLKEKGMGFIYISKVDEALGFIEGGELKL